MSEKFYYIFSHERNMYWKSNSVGYTHDLEEAGQYNKKDALNICKNANEFCEAGRLEESMIPVPLDKIKT